jgi:hypothetical protein
VTGAYIGSLGRVFNEVPELYDRTRPSYPDALFADLAEITGLGQRAGYSRWAAAPARQRGHWHRSGAR